MRVGLAEEPAAAAFECLVSDNRGDLLDDWRVAKRFVAGVEWTVVRR